MKKIICDKTASEIVKKAFSFISFIVNNSSTKIKLMSSIWTMTSMEATHCQAVYVHYSVQHAIFSDAVLQPADN